MEKEYFVTRHAAAADNSFALDDNIMVRGGLTTSGSKMLYNFVSPLQATIVDKLLDSGMELTGKTKLDEFAVPGITEETFNELSGAVGAVSDRSCRIALCNDVSGKNRRQAPQKGLYYIHPTYGTVSRFGLVPTVSSMDQIGVVCRDIDDGFKALGIIAGHDEKDYTTYPEKTYSYTPKDGPFRIGIPSNVVNRADEESKKTIDEFAGRFGAGKFELEYFGVLPQVMYILSSAEIGNNTSRYDGIKFGYRTGNFTGLNDLYANTRTEGFGPDMKLASITGAYVLSKKNYETCYLKSMKIRRLVKEHANDLFSRYDAVVLPLWLEDSDPYKNLALYALATLCGLPSVSMPFGSGGLQLIAQAKNENILYGICKGAKKDGV